MKSIFSKNNKGITLVEIIVVTSIIAVLASAGIHSLGLISSGRAKQFVSECESMIARCKINTVAGVRDDTFLKIYQEDGIFYGGLYEDSTEVLKTELGKGMDCTFETVGSDGFTHVTTYTLNSSRPVCLGFNRTTGAFEPLNKYNSINADIEGVYLQCINVSYGLNTFKITLVPATGYYYIN